MMVLVRQYPPPLPTATVNDCIRSVSGLMSDHADPADAFPCLFFTKQKHSGVLSAAYSITVAGAALE